MALKFENRNGIMVYTGSHEEFESDIKILEDTYFGQGGALEHLKELRGVDSYCEYDESLPKVEISADDIKKIKTVIEKVKKETEGMTEEERINYCIENMVGGISLAG